MKNLKDMNNTNMLKRFFTLVFVLGLGMATAWAYDFTAVAPSGQTLYYTITDANNHYVQVVAPGGNSYSGWNDYTKPTGDLTLPSVVNTNEIDYSVTSINQYAFYGCSGLTSVEIPYSVTSLGIAAFSECSGLTSVYYTGDLAQWCGMTFSNSNPFNYGYNLYINNLLVTELVIPNSVTTIGNYAFSNCISLTSVEVPNSVTTIGQCAFQNCSGLTSVEIPNSVTSIGGSAFSYCSGLTSVEIPNSVTAIANGAFNGCSGLAFLTIGEGVTSIGGSAFGNCPNLTTVNFNAINCTSMVTIYTNTQQYSVFSSGTSSQSASPIVMLTIGGNVTQIPDHAFRNSPNLTSLTIGNSVTSIGNYAFNGCSSLTSLEIPNSVTTIGQYAFQGCSGLTGDLAIPNSVTTIGKYAFQNCSGLTGDLAIPNSVTTIDQYAFSYCRGLTSVEIPNSMTTIAPRTFENCSGLTSVTLPNSVTSIGSYAFNYCSGLTSVAIPNSVTSIGGYAFSDCSGLTSVAIPNSVTAIGGGAFSYCSAVTSVTIGNSVTSIGNYAFSGCSHLTSVAVLAETPPTLSYNAFNGVSTGIPVYVPCESATAYQNASGWNNFTNITAVCTVSIVASSSSNQGGTVAGGGTFDFGATCTLTATPNPGYYFWYWTENGVVVSNDASYSFTVVHDRNLVAVFSTSNPADAIQFADANVKALCVTNWDGNGDGELSYVEAASVSTLANVFKGNSVITAFDELQYFIGLSAVNQYAFQDCVGLTSVQIPNSVISIGQYAFQGCSGLTGDLIIPNSVTTIGQCAFQNCSGLTSVEIPNSVTTIKDCTFYGCSGLTSVEIPNSVTSIGGSAFSYCSGLTSVEIPNSVTTIGNRAFFSCSELTSVTIGEGVSTIGELAFWYCPSLTTLNFNAINCTQLYTRTGSASWNYEYYSAFGSDPSFVTLNIGDYVTRIPDYAFYRFSSLTGELTIPNSVTTIGQYAFQGCSGLTGDLAIPNSVTTIGQYAFQGCSGLTGDLAIPNSVTTIGQYAFSGCYNLTGELIIPNSVTTIAKGSFNNCARFTSVTIGNSVTEIGESAFSDCSRLTSVEIPNSVTRINKNAFYRCDHLTSVYYLGDLAQWCNIVFYYGYLHSGNNDYGRIENVSSNPLCYAHDLYINNELLTELVIPETVTTIKTASFVGASFHTISINNSVTSIGYFAFFSCNYLTSVEIPNSVTTIGNWAFDRCSSLSSVTIGNSVTTIGDYAFRGCNQLTSVAVLAETPPALSSNAFQSVSTTIPVYVPCESVSAYQSASGWNGFTNITAVCTVSIVASSSSNQGGTVAGGGTFDFGATCTLTATPSPGYHFWYWMENELIVSKSATYSFAVAHDRNLVAVFSTTNLTDAIQFADANVKTLCVTNWDGNGDGELSYAEAGSVRFLRSVFKGNSEILAFDELQYFTGLRFITEYAFQNCVSLTSVTIPNSVISIGQYAFSGCSSLTGELVIPNSVTTMGQYAFSGCRSLTSVEIPNLVTTIATRAFENCSGLTSLVVPDWVTIIDDGAFFGNTSLTEVTIGEGVTRIGGYSFFNCPNLLTVHFNAINCTSCYTGIYSSFGTRADIPYNGSITPIGYLTIGENVTRIPSKAFKGSTNLTSLIISNSVNSIESEAFLGCNHLTELTIGNSVTNIGSGAFNGCSNLTTLHVLNEIPPGISYNNNSSSDTFYGVPKSIPVYVPCGFADTYRSTSGWSSFTNIIDACPFEVNVIINPSGAATIEGAGTYTNLDVCTLSYEASYGYTFLNWMEDGEVVSTDDTYSFVVTEDHDITANFQYIEQHWPLPQGYEGNMTLTGIITIDGEEQTSDFIELAAFIGDECHGTALPINVNGQRVYFLTIMGDNADEGEAVSFKLYDHQQQEELDLLCTNTINYQHDAVYGLDEFYVLNFLNYVVITATADPVEGGTIEGAGNHFPGLEATLTATANTGYTFQNWTKNGTVVSTNAAYTFTITEAESYVAHFTLNSYDLTVSADPTEGGSVTGGGTYNHFAECTLTATANTGYTFQNWTLNDEVVSTDAEYTFEVSGGGEYVAHFQLNSYEIAATADPTEGGTIEGAGTYNHFETCTLTATAATGYTFQNWTLDGEEVSTATELSFEVNAPAAYVAHFTLNSYEIAVLASPAQGGTVSGGGTYAHFASCTLTATAAEGYQFNSWVADGTTVSTDATYTFEVSGPATITAMFDLVQTVTMSNGWTWWGTSVELTSLGSDGGLGVLEQGLGDFGVIIKHGTQYAQNYSSYGYGWMGTLSKLENEKGYKIQTTQSCDVTITGPLAEPGDHPIELVQGWNWIGYPVVQAQSVSSALAGLTPTSGDIIKGQGPFSTYYEGMGWLPEFNLEPGKGYLYYSGNEENQTFTYANAGSKSAIVAVDDRHWRNDVHAYADNLCLWAVVSIGGEEQRTESLELGAFVDGECRGSAKLIYVAPFDRYYALMTVAGESGETIEFALLDEAHNQVSTDCTCHITFVNDAIVGGFETPYQVDFGTMTVIEEYASNLYMYPNPVARNAAFNLVLPEDETVAELYIVDMKGAVVRHETGAISHYSISGLPTSGLYVIRAVCKSGKVYQSRLAVD